MWCMLLVEFGVKMDNLVVYVPLLRLIQLQTSQPNADENMTKLYTLMYQSGTFSGI